jgi:RNA polymerase-binding transcription factor DksA
VATKSAPQSISTFGTAGNSFHLPEPRGVSKDGIAYTKDFDIKFLKAQRDLLDEEKAKLMGQATRLENEANSLIEEAEMGDVQFDDEGGEGDTMVVERERDLALSAQARQTIADIDQALERLAKGTYGYSEASGRPIPRERLEAIPWATELVEEKVGGIGRR